MADTMQFDLVSPERKLLSAQASEVQIPGADGELTAMPGHTPMITTLRPGLLKVTVNGQVTEFAVTGGFAEISPEGVSVLAERSLPKPEVTQPVLDEWVAEAHKAHKEAHHTVVDDAAQMLADMVAMGTHIGLDPTVPNF
ncbi:F0F1 ATP synthase subunit epsilon [Pararhodobacter zhoushanensis]|uniref:ATP synthase epsilon chain n=1 Tax=Pararhodobacter zhoushanensis TaxID=2479545 RepID=A0ABT3H312_9RHOB|nr:F0F1 ATP synthase subunit epsilon [Pararhodobacter zhoushanensis]MCW1934156.1 F0F1 ATP synthase subunit epsilon [Pararhodobacter zhoushanensis]